MSAVLALTRLYLLGSLRRQVHLSTLFLGVVLFMMPAYVNTFSLGPEAFGRVTKDFGLTLISYFAVAMALLLGSSTVPADLEKRSVHPILARPVSRGVYLAAHLLAAAALLGGSVLYLGICLQISVSVILRQIDWSLFIPLYTGFLQATLIAGVAMAISIRGGAMAGALVGAVLFLVGNISEDFVQLWMPSGSTLAGLVKSLAPDLTSFALKDAVVHQVLPSPGYLAALTLYGAGWTALSLLLARAWFEEVDL